MTHRVSVWLCQTHGADTYLRRNGGATFAERLLRTWSAAGAITTRRLAAVRTHQRQIREALRGRDLPGSYAWPDLRREAEELFATGYDPDLVIRELRTRYTNTALRAPSPRTMRRWFTQARWRHPRRGRPRPPTTAPVWRERRIKPIGYDLIPWAFIQHHPASRVVFERDAP